MAWTSICYLLRTRHSSVYLEFNQWTKQTILEVVFLQEQIKISHKYKKEVNCVVCSKVINAEESWKKFIRIAEIGSTWVGVGRAGFSGSSHWECDDGDRIWGGCRSSHHLADSGRLLQAEGTSRLKPNEGGGAMWGYEVRGSQVGRVFWRSVHWI